jgi:hypothetical protein
MSLQVETWIIEGSLTILFGLFLALICSQVIEACDTDIEHQKEEQNGNDRRTTKTD